MARDEAVLFPVFLRYYSKLFLPHEIFVSDHLTTDGSLDAGLKMLSLPSRRLSAEDLGSSAFVCVNLQAALNGTRTPFNPHFGPDLWCTKVVADVVKLVLEKCAFKAMVLVDVDEKAVQTHDMMNTRMGFAMSLTTLLLRPSAKSG
eukprot:gnl/MRDRNA2_/MRDRNA2_33101_c0_seq1.p1 gnl/MRDRNA2_/MRDRNA2_33101_c0~~gnl/MRDRNA2_/MRDRNA2_33101_c0_seq1.p1  ORF type:complete len:165 (-),score=27.89 gnl/MRDRNA2_/MRDRNA2_33101_c0_seq1:428-865(-)